MQVQTLRRQLEALEKNHGLNGISPVTQHHWFSEQQIVGIRANHIDKVLEVYMRPLPAERKGFQPHGLLSMIRQSADFDWYVSLEIEPGNFQPMVGVINFVPNDRRKSVSFLNDVGQTASADVSSGIMELHTYANVSWNDVEVMSQWMAMQPGADEAVTNSFMAIFDATQRSLGL